MILQKNGLTYKLTDKTQIEAFLGSGWTVADEEKADEEKIKNRKKGD